MYNFDIVESLTVNSQDSSTCLFLSLNQFHNYIMAILMLILVVCSYLMIQALISNLYVRELVDHPILELIWTIVPAFVLLFIAFPSLSVLYRMDDVIEPAVTIKAVGNQWYWTYEYGDYNSELEYQSYLISSEDLSEGDFRLREVDNRIIVPVESNIKVLATSNDVIHAWAVPSLGVKIDAMPGRLNQISFQTNRPGIFAGGCSEICGSEHSYMPITVESVSPELFARWVFTFA